MIRVTAAGSLPGDDFRGALNAMTELLPEVLPLPELPARGVESGMIGRALGLIEDLDFDLQPAGWRLTHGSGMDHRRARAQWRRDLDDMAELLAGFTGLVKIGLAGPWTLAASVERPNGDRILADHGARREVGQALREGWDRLQRELRRLLPGTRILLQLDEPMLVAVSTGGIRTASGFSRHRAVSAEELAATLGPFTPDAWLHCCAPGAWLGTAARAGFGTVAVDSRLFAGTDLDVLTEWVHDGGELALGVVDTANPRPQRVDEVLRETLRVLRALELPMTTLPERLVLTTACGLAGWRISDIPGQLESLREAAAHAQENLAEG